MDLDLDELLNSLMAGTPVACTRDDPQPFSEIVRSDLRSGRFHNNLHSHYCQLFIIITQPHIT